MREATQYRDVIAAALVLGSAMTGTAWSQAAPAQEKPALPQYKSSPYHGVTNGDGKVIPCRCLFRGTGYMLDEKVCMSTPQGTVITICGFQQNNTSWIPTSEPCTTS